MFIPQKKEKKLWKEVRVQTVKAEYYRSVYRGVISMLCVVRHVMRCGMLSSSESQLRSVSLFLPGTCSSNYQFLRRYFFLKCLEDTVSLFVRSLIPLFSDFWWRLSSVSKTRVGSFNLVVSQAKSSLKWSGCFFTNLSISLFWVILKYHQNSNYKKYWLRFMKQIVLS